MPQVEIKISDHKDDVMRALKEKLPIALESIGAEAATYAIKDCPMDTGRLRNSITWATKSKTGGGNNGNGGESTPEGKPEENSVYIGSNVEYAAAQEYGDYKHKVGKKHFLRDAAANHSEHYKAILEAALKS